jgi:hypothetical protein
VDEAHLDGVEVRATEETACVVVEFHRHHPLVLCRCGKRRRLAVLVESVEEPLHERLVVSGDSVDAGLEKELDGGRPGGECREAGGAEDVGGRADLCSS